jgi:NagD protein
LPALVCRFRLLLAFLKIAIVLSGVSTPETLKEYAYRPTIVLNGVGDIVAAAHSYVVGH